MCQSAAYLRGRKAIIAADTRWSKAHGEGLTGEFHDWGGRVRRVPGGWVTATGDGGLGINVYGNLERHAALPPDRVRRIVQGLHSELGGRSLDGRPLDTVVFHVHETAGGYTLSLTSSTKPELTRDNGHSSEWAYGMLYPAPDSLEGSGRTADQLQAEMASRLNQEKNVGGWVRIIAEYFRFGFENGRLVSDEIEAGVSVWPEHRTRPQALHLRKPLAWVSKATDRQIEAALVPAARGVVPFGTLQAEYRRHTRQPAEVAG